MRYGLLIIAALILAISFFETSSLVQEARHYVSLENYESKDVPCETLLSERPWYGVINYWFFTWVILVPTLIFSISPQAPAWLRGGRIIVAIATCYALLNLMIHMQWDIRNAPFQENTYHSDPLNGWRMDCLNIADGFSLIMARNHGWIPAAVYTWFCLFLWTQYHRRITKKITASSKQDMFSYLFSSGVKIYFIMVVIYWLSIILFVTAIQYAGEPPFHPGILGMLSFYITRPLITPIEIFYY